MHNSDLEMLLQQQHFPIRTQFHITPKQKRWFFHGAYISVTKFLSMLKKLMESFQTFYEILVGLQFLLHRCQIGRYEYSTGEK